MAAVRLMSLILPNPAPQQKERRLLQQAKAGLVIQVFWWLFTTILRWQVFPSTASKGENDQ